MSAPYWAWESLDGWVLIGIRRFDEEQRILKELGTPEYVLENPHALMRWGTTRGIGELVDGPTTMTTFSPFPGATIFCNPRRTQKIYELKNDAWQAFILPLNVDKEAWLKRYSSPDAPPPYVDREDGGANPWQSGNSPYGEQDYEEEEESEEDDEDHEDDE